MYPNADNLKHQITQNKNFLDTDRNFIPVFHKNSLFPEKAERYKISLPAKTFDSW